jgi:hypothetical protein
MKLLTTIAAAVLALGLCSVPPPAQAANKSQQSSVRVQKSDYKKTLTAALRRSASPQAKAKRSDFFQRLASKPKEFFQRHTPQVRHRNEGVPPEAYMNVPRPVVSESSIF